MRLWHEDLLSYISLQRLLGQHRECCAMRGKGWGRKHSTVDYVWCYSYSSLFRYHVGVMEQCERRGVSIDPLWGDPLYRGKTLGHVASVSDLPGGYGATQRYREHNEAYLAECLTLLRERGEIIVFED